VFGQEVGGGNYEPDYDATWHNTEAMKLGKKNYF